jgi:N6-adenosine-specific RNA methylase IME4
MGRAAENHYRTEELDALKAFKVPADKDSVLLLWSTSSMLPEALQLMTAWHFKYKTQAVWVKPSFGLGYWWRQQHELLLLGTRGKMRAPPPELRFPSVILAPRRRHSEKPDEAAEMIERMFPNVPRLEMFARVRRPSWDAWGDEV